MNSKHSRIRTHDFWKHVTCSDNSDHSDHSDAATTKLARLVMESIELNGPFASNVLVYQEGTVYWLVVWNIFSHNIWDNSSHFPLTNIFFKMVKNTNQVYDAHLNEDQIYLTKSIRKPFGKVGVSSYRRSGTWRRQCTLARNKGLSFSGPRGPILWN